MAHLTDALAVLKDALHAGRVAQFEISSGSMSPLLCKGDIVFAEAVSLEQLRFGDYILFVRDQQIWLHRFFLHRSSTSKRQIITKGDWRWRFDLPPATERDLIARVIGLSDNQFRNSLAFNLVTSKVIAGMSFFIGSLNYSALKISRTLHYSQK